MAAVLASAASAALVLVLLTLVPGPDVAVVTRVALADGRRAAARTAAGVVTGLLAWGALTVAGLAAVLAASASAYAVVKVVGAAYLVALGVVTVWRAGRADPGRPDRERRGTGRPWLTGLATNLLNPKIAVFYAGLLPHLVPAGAPTTVSLVCLVAFHAVVSLVWLNAYAALLHRARGTLQRPRVRAALDRVTGLALIGFGVRVAAQTRPAV